MPSKLHLFTSSDEDPLRGYACRLEREMGRRPNIVIRPAGLWRDCNMAWHGQDQRNKRLYQRGLRVPNKNHVKRLLTN